MQPSRLWLKFLSTTATFNHVSIPILEVGEVVFFDRIAIAVAPLQPGVYDVIKIKINVGIVSMYDAESYWNSLKKTP